MRQPLARVFVKVREPSEAEAVEQLQSHILEELNVREVVLIHHEADFLRYEVRPNLPVLGPKYGPAVGEIQRALAAQDPTAVAASIAAGHTIELAGHVLESSELLVTAVEKEGYASAQEGGYVVVVDTELTPELRDEGLARELVHRIQNLRRDAGFDIADRISTYWQGGLGRQGGAASGAPTAAADLRRVVETHAGYIRGETLSLELVEGPPPPDSHSSEQQIEGTKVVLGVRRV